jgi:Flp pilus assembly pilin Flp
MQQTVLALCVKSKLLIDAIKDEQGQDLVEYAAVISLVVLGITAGMSTLASGINDAMTTVSGRVNTTLG